MAVNGINSKAAGYAACTGAAKTVAGVIAVVMIAAVAAGCAFTGAAEQENEATTVEAQPETEQSTFRFYGDGWYLDAPYTVGEGENTVELTHTVRETTEGGLFYVFHAGEDAALSVIWDDTPADAWFDPEVSHWGEGFTLNPEQRVVSHEFNGELIEDYYVDAAEGCYVLTLGGTKYRDEMRVMAKSFTIDPSAKMVFANSEALRDLLAQLSPADVRLNFYDYEGLQGSVDGASALAAADYLAAFAGIEWIDADPMDEGARADNWHIELDAPGWRLTSYQSSRRVLVETSGGELWLTARIIPDAQYSWMSFDTLENWYQNALAAEANRGSGTPLTAGELFAWREELATSYTEGDTTYLTPVSCFFTSFYDDPRDLDLTEFLRYCPLAEGVEDEAEFDALNLDWKVEGGVWQRMTLDQMPSPTWRYRVPRINEVLMQYAGITLDDMSTDWRAAALYVPEYDAFYNFTSDFGPGVFRPDYGERSRDTVTLYCRSDEGYRVLTLRYMPDGGYHIMSHLSDAET